MFLSRTSRVKRKRAGNSCERAVLIMSTALFYIEGPVYKSIAQFSLLRRKRAEGEKNSRNGMRKSRADQVICRG